MQKSSKVRIYSETWNRKWKFESIWGNDEKENG